MKELEEFIEKTCEFSRCKRDDLFGNSIAENITLAKGRVYAYCRDVLGWSPLDTAIYLGSNERSAYAVLKKHDKLFPKKTLD